ncbi:MAG: hypothetical protein FWE35_03870 [Streptosporangiales bacterium]|nr:hypothetical protein [Streptosporangiales bacterium]
MIQQPPSRAVAAGGLALAGARLAYAALRRRPPGGEGNWTRTNHRGEPVTLVEGPAVTAGALAGLSLLPGSVPLAIAGTGAAAFGALDDLAGSGKRRGLRGHLGALLHGEVTTGAVKLLGIGATGVASAATLGGDPVDVAINSGLIAGSANLLNLFDLRPGRAIKVAGVSGTLLAAVGAGPAAAPALGAAAALLPDDLGERAMLGDCGANALGALLGGAAAAALSRPARAGLLAGITGLTLASEKISFTRVIASTPALNWVDMLGRRPAEPAAPAP